MTTDVERSYRDHLTAGDLALLNDVVGDQPLLGALSSPRLEQVVFGAESQLDPTRAASPFLTFAVAVHRVAERLTTTTYVDEWIGPRQRVPVFAVEPLRQLLADPLRRFFFVELLASYTHVVSGSTWVATRRGWRRRRFSELDPVQLAGLLEAVPAAERPGVFRRLGDLSLFLTGVFPDHTAEHPARVAAGGGGAAADGWNRNRRDAARVAPSVRAPRAAGRALVPTGHPPGAGTEWIGRGDRSDRRTVQRRPADPQRRHRHLPVPVPRTMVRSARGVNYTEPPETSMLTPVTYEASSDSRNATTRATSSVEPYRRSGTIAVIWRATSDGSSA